METKQLIIFAVPLPYKDHTLTLQCLSTLYEHLPVEKMEYLPEYLLIERKKNQLLAKNLGCG